MKHGKTCNVKSGNSGTGKVPKQKPASALAAKTVKGAKGAKK